MMSLRASALLTTLMLGLAFLPLACGDERPAGQAPPGGGPVRVSEPPASPPPAPPIDAGVEAGEPIGPELCNGVEQQSQDIAENETIFPPDAPEGGAIPPGLYVLRESNIYNAQPDGGPEGPPLVPTGKLTRVTIYVTGQTMRFIEAHGLYDPDGGTFDPDDVYAATYKTSGSSLELTRVCPTAGGVNTLPYTMKGNLLTIFPSPGRYDTYLLKTF